MLSVRILRSILVTKPAHIALKAPPKLFSKPVQLQKTTYATLYPMMAYSTVERGAPNTLDYRVFFKDGSGRVVSPFHDIPLHANAEKTVFNMVVEVPRWTNAKMEIDVKGSMNPIKQDVKKGKLRYVKNCFPHHGYIWNYGALPQVPIGTCEEPEHTVPNLLQLVAGIVREHYWFQLDTCWQTWEDPDHCDENTKCKGDNDPLDVCEIGQRIAERGEVMKVKVLGTLAMIDEGETDWKVLAINVDDPLAPKINGGQLCNKILIREEIGALMFLDISDIEREMPGYIEKTFEWFRIYKVPDGKPLNTFAFDSKPKDKAFALSVINQTHAQWSVLIKSTEPKDSISVSNVSVEGSSGKITAEAAQAVVDASAAPAPAEPISPEVDKWHYVTSN